MQPWWGQRCCGAVWTGCWECSTGIWIHVKTLELFPSCWQHPGVPSAIHPSGVASTAESRLVQDCLTEGYETRPSGRKSRDSSGRSPSEFPALLAEISVATILQLRLSLGSGGLLSLPPRLSPPLPQTTPQPISATSLRVGFLGGGGGDTWPATASKGGRSSKQIKQQTTASEVDSTF